MSETLIFNDGGDPGGAIGVHSTVCLSFESDKVPSCFLYRVEALSGGFDIVTSFVGRDVDAKVQTRSVSFQREHTTAFSGVFFIIRQNNSNTISLRL